MQQDLAADAAKRAFHDLYDPVPGEPCWELRNGKNETLLTTDTEEEALARANSQWAQWGVTHDPDLGPGLPRALIEVDQWGDEIFVCSFPEDSEPSYYLGEDFDKISKLQFRSHQEETANG